MAMTNLSLLDLRDVLKMGTINKSNRKLCV